MPLRPQPPPLLQTASGWQGSTASTSPAAPQGLAAAPLLLEAALARRALSEQCPLTASGPLDGRAASSPPGGFGAESTASQQPIVMQESDSSTQELCCSDGVLPTALPVGSLEDPAAANRPFAVTLNEMALQTIPWQKRSLEQRESLLERYYRHHHMQRMRESSSEQLPAVSLPSEPSEHQLNSVAGEQQRAQAEDCGPMSRSVMLPRGTSSTGLRQTGSVRSRMTPRVVAPLMLPGMPANSLNTSCSTHGNTRRGAQTARSSRRRRSLWAAKQLAPFSSFLSARQGQGDKKDTEERGRNRRGQDEDLMGEPELHAMRTADMVDTLQQWIGKHAQQDAPNEDPVAAFMQEFAQGISREEARGMILLAKKHHMALKTVMEAYKAFRKHDRKGVGTISEESFIRHVRKRANIPEGENIPPHLLQGMHAQSDAIGFEDFLQWSVNTAWTEEMLMPNHEERKLRQLARQQEIPLPDVERIKRIFDHFDTNKSGMIEEEEFRGMVYKLLKVKNTADIPVKRLQRYWREIDLDSGGTISFKEFLIWYRKANLDEGKAL